MRSASVFSGCMKTELPTLAWVAALLAVLGSVRAPAAVQLGRDDLDREFKFAAELIELELPDYAQFVADRVLEQHPDQKDRANVVRAEALVEQRQFEAARALLADMPADGPQTQAIKLLLADGYYQVGKLDACSALYREYFDRFADSLPTDPDLLRVYRTAAHKFGQMLARKDESAEAARIYSLLIQVVEGTDMRRQVLLEQTELLLKAAAGLDAKERRKTLEQADANCAEILWGGMDLWFGRALTALAQITALRGNRNDAVSLLRTNLDMLKKLDVLLEDSGIPLSESPFAGGRMLLGSLYESDADLLMAAQEPREAGALDLLEQATAEYESVWNLIVRTYKHDQAIMEKAGGDRSVLGGTISQRREPFDVIGRAVSDFEKALRADRPGGWTAALAERAGKLAGRVAALRAGVEKHPREIGVTARREMQIDDRFEGFRLRDRALDLLADEGARKQKAIEGYTHALQQYYNVFAGYPGSAWSTESNVKVALLKDRLHALTGREVVIKARDSGERKIGLVMLYEGNKLFERKDYARAVESYLDGLARNPDGAEAYVALASLLESYKALNDPLRVKMVARYVGERLRDRPEAPQMLLRIGRLYFEAGDRPMYDYLYELYLARFPDHVVAPTILYMLGEQHWKEEDHAGALPYYERLVDRYAKSGHFLKALNRIGWAHYLQKNFEPAAEAFTRLVDEAPHGEAKAQAKLFLADSYRQMATYGKAVKHYRELTRWLSDKALIYVRNPGAAGDLKDALEQAVFFQAYCLSQIDEPEDRVPAYREAAVKLYRSFIKRFPSSELGPTALSSMGAVLLASGASEEAAAAYEELARRYPESEAGQNARFAMVRSLLDVGQTAKAAEVLNEMLADTAAHPVAHFMHIGGQMLANEAYDEALRCFETVHGAVAAMDAPTPEDQRMDQRALFGIGEANVAAGRHEAAVAGVNRLIETYPTTGLFFDARFLLARTYKQLGQPGQAVEVLKDIFKRATDQALLNRATLELAHLQIDQGDSDGALASTQRIVLLVDPAAAATRAIFEEALYVSIDLLGQKERWMDVIANGDQYIELFPSGQWINEVRRWRTKAAVNTAEEGGDA